MTCPSDALSPLAGGAPAPPGFSPHPGLQAGRREGPGERVARPGDLSVLEQRALMRRCEDLAQRGQGCCHAELVFLLDRVCALQEDLASVLRSEEWALSRVERRQKGACNG